ncbi:MAG: site-specific DNA-methyltransferase [Candidatus Omnitrophota bacterium]|jgi:adenine-specific DNA-methyltransferase|nr:MAG: site-specific DNA-methyltransferase [Candidatus Omnitrophota bacterium]
MFKKKNSKTIPVQTITHKDKRANIPTEELRDFVIDDEKQPKKIRYPRNTDLDPQLVWKGKDDQDEHPLEVEAVPIYIQEKIHPHALIENVRAQAKKQTDLQMTLFDDFNGIDDFEDRIDFYSHEMNWSNRMILGDSLYVMTSLAEKEGLKGKVQMIYLDPPYGIKFNSNWQISTRKRDVKDGKAEDVTRQPEQIQAFRDTWKNGIHSYLSYLRDLLVVARELLTETGSVFVQIGDENVHIVRCLLDEVFGGDNYVSLIPFVTTSSQTSELLPNICDYVLWYCKNKKFVKYRQLFSDKQVGKTGGKKYTKVELKNGERSSFKEIVKKNKGKIPEGAKIFRPSPLVSQSGGERSSFSVSFNGKEFKPRNGFWKTNNDGFKRINDSNRLYIEGNSLAYIRYLEDFKAYPKNNFWSDTWGIQSRTDPKKYVVQTDNKTVERCILMSTDPGDLVLDPTCGSGTTAYVAEQWGRRWITTDTSRVALALARTRLMSAKFPYYFLSDSQDGLQKEMEITGKIPPQRETFNDIKKGFVYKRVPHITLKAIANNEEIDVIYDKWQQKMEPVREALNQELKLKWEEWEIPRTTEEKWSKEAKELHKRWWSLRLDRQKEIDDCIQKNADYEYLFDQPYEDNKRIRVTGPFTVESLSPHRVLSTDIDRPQSELEAEQEKGNGQFELTILENMKKAGVQNTIKNERLKFDRLEPFAGTWIHAEGEYTDKDGSSRRVAVSIGPEHGTVGPELIKEAAKEAVQGIGYDLLLVCGFAFDPHINEEVKRYGNLTILPTRMNHDLVMGDDLLKKTGSGNLFMVFGEPDIEVEKAKDGRIVVEIKGVDIYDPTTGMIRSHSTDDIACWFIDTNYNGESFFVRHAYFTGADQPFDKLKRALKAEINEEAWSTLYSTKSYPFDPPETGKIGVKVINHYGDEVLKVYRMRE